LDKAGQDINAAANFNILSVQTRLAGKVTGPDALGAKTSGLIEGEFFGTADGDTNGFRLRHAYVKLNWKKSELMIGQFWHAMFITDCYPDVVSFNTGAPFQPFSRTPQVRFTQAFGKLSLIATALSQRDFASNGPEGVSSVWTIKAEAVYGQNLHHLTMLGGYGVDGIADPVRKTQEYSPLDTLSFWAEAHTNGA
jgi:hypothetical protein